MGLGTGRPQPAEDSLGPYRNQCSHKGSSVSSRSPGEASKAGSRSHEISDQERTRASDLMPSLLGPMEKLALPGTEQTGASYLEHHPHPSFSQGGQSRPGSPLMGQGLRAGAWGSEGGVLGPTHLCTTLGKLASQSLLPHLQYGDNNAYFVKLRDTLPGAPLILSKQSPPRHSEITCN